MSEERVVTEFREYLKIRTDHPKPAYDEAITFLKKIADGIGLKTKVTGLPGHPILVATWEGSNPELPAVLLNSHTDVVPAVNEKWNIDPFSAYKDEAGNIYARGTQDMKCVTIQYFEAIRRMRAQNVRLARTIHLSFVPDEEIGATQGMAHWVTTQEFKDLNVGFALDEGLANPTSAFTVFYAERAPFWVRIKSTGPTGHGSRFVEHTAVEKLMKVLNSAMDYRKDQFDKLHRGQHECGMTLGDVVTVNITMMNVGVTSDGGKTYSLNVIPTQAEAGMDIRVPPSEMENMKKRLEDWTSEQGLELQYVNPVVPNIITPTTPDNIWWVSFERAINSMGLKIQKEIFPAATDSRFIRNVGIPALGFSPINETPILLHDHNEFLNEQVFLKGVDIYVNIIREIANTPAVSH